MLPAKYRLRKQGRIGWVSRRGKTQFSEDFVVNWLPNKLDYSRFAFVASKKVGGAVERNRALRVLREAVRGLLAEFPEGFDFVVVARKNILAKKMPEVKQELSDWLKAGI